MMTPLKLAVQRIKAATAARRYCAAHVERCALAHLRELKN